MLRLYIEYHGSFTFNRGEQDVLQLLQTYKGNLTFECGDRGSRSLPTNKPTNRTKDAYTEQPIYGAGINPVLVAVLREGKLETLDKLPSPFPSDSIQRPDRNIKKRAKKSDGARKKSKVRTRTSTKPRTSKVQRPTNKATISKRVSKVRIVRKTVASKPKRTTSKPRNTRRSSSR